MLFMYKSILQFHEKGMLKLEKITEKFYEHPENLTDFILGVKEDVIELGLAIISEALSDMDQAIRECPRRSQDWYIVRKDSCQKLTSLGNVIYEKTLFKNKKTGKSEYLLDSIMGMSPHERITSDAVAQILDEAAVSSYRRGGEQASLTDSVTKQTVEKLIHKLQFPEEASVEKKKQVKYLFIDADEDHVSLQFKETKGDLELNENGRKSNTCEPKLIYLYEGWHDTGKKTPRIVLENVHYFSGLYEGSAGNQLLWEEVNAYISNHYDADILEKVFISSDGGNWIKGACTYVNGAVPVLDKFHLQKYIRSAAGHMDDAKDDCIEQINQAIQQEDKKEVLRVLRIMADYTDCETRKEVVAKCRKYLLNNWESIRNGIKYKEVLHGCSAEGHVSHILSDRLSSRPLGWSKVGVDKMSRLRVYIANGGNLQELAEMQREKIQIDPKKKAKVFSSAAVQAYQRFGAKELSKYHDLINKRIDSQQLKKTAMIRFHVSGL